MSALSKAQCDDPHVFIDPAARETIRLLHAAWMAERQWRLAVGGRDEAEWAWNATEARNALPKDWWEGVPAKYPGYPDDGGMGR